MQGTTIPDCTWVRSFEADSGSLGLGADVRPRDRGLRRADCAWDEPTCSQVMGRPVLSDVQSAKDFRARSQSAAVLSPTKKDACFSISVLAVRYICMVDNDCI